MEQVSAFMQSLMKNCPNLSKNLNDKVCSRSVKGCYALDDSEITTYKNEICDIEQRQEKCKSCTGNFLDNCDGMEHLVEISSGKFAHIVKPCKFKEIRDNQKRKERLLSSAHIPLRFKGLTFNDYQLTSANKGAVKLAMGLVKEQHCGAYFFGDCGTGKTMLATIIANEKALEGQDVIFSSFLDLLADIKASFGNNSTNDVVKAIRECQCLILDDLGTEKITEWVSEQLFSIINHRSSNDLQTIITANYSLSDLAVRLSASNSNGNYIQGQRITSRIMGMCDCVKIGGADWRKKT